MMREIKFRAWKHTYTQIGTAGYGEMIYDIKSGNSIWNNEDIEINQILKSNPILLQYTGLKDKNGKEIYEGDVINVFDSDTEFLGHGKIIFNDFSWSIEWIEKSGNFTMLFSEWYEEEKTIEVIGNIYQNPQLIE